MNEITIGQVALALGTITAIWTFYQKVMKTIKETFDEKLDPMKKDIAMMSDVVYQMLDHMATNNNSGGMKAALDDYNKYNRHKSVEK